MSDLREFLAGCNGRVAADLTADVWLTNGDIEEAGGRGHELVEFEMAPKLTGPPGYVTVTPTQAVPALRTEVNVALNDARLAIGASQAAMPGHSHRSLHMALEALVKAVDALERAR